MKTLSSFFLSLLATLSPTAAEADLSLQGLAATVADTTVTYTVNACSDSYTTSTVVGIYYNPSKAPVVGQLPDQTQSVQASISCTAVTAVRSGVAVGLYQSYAFIDPQGLITESNESNNSTGPVEVCVGPDLQIKKGSFSVEKSGASVTYKITVCNEGSQTANKFRVGFWHNRKAAPSSTEMGDIFQAISSLAGNSTCTKELTVAAGLQPNGSFTAWARVDSGEFVTECRETNNTAGPVNYTMSNPDLAVTAFSATVSGSKVTYSTKVCNKGTEAVSKFYVDVYYHRPKAAPIIGEPGDQAQAVNSLNKSACTSLSFVRNSAPDGSYTSYVMADPDDYVSEPNESNNLSSSLAVTVGQGSSTTTGSCTDTDKDGAGVGSGCTGVPDCNDNNAKINPKATEICGNKIDEDCDLTPDDGCPGVDCTDADGDSFGKGKDCVLADCDDNNKNVYPWAAETCGDGKDNNCNKIVDDGCSGVNCVDSDMDGAGVGAGCTGVPDCDDTNYKLSPTATEICGNKIDEDCDLTPDDGCPGVDCTDADGDGFGKGKGCVLADCDDTNKSIYPWAKETCGDNVDDNCNGIADDGCSGRQCTDQDADGYGVGAGCPGPQDCNDQSYGINPAAKEICGNGIDEDCDNAVDDGCSTSVDNDGDGDYVGGGTAGQQDCDDQDSSIGPSQPETCGDDVDNDCDGTIDDGCTGVKCTDGDGDGWGIGVDCKLPDCNDKSASVYPWAVEACGDGVDNDCDGTIDDGCTGVLCTDKDLDGFGKGTGCCNDPKSKSTCRQDCDDADGGIHPWAKEICADSKDNNCDGSIDEKCTICSDQDGDTYGIGPQCSNWDCDDTDAESHPGASEICNEKDNDCNGAVDDNCSEEGGCQCRALPGPGRGIWSLLLLSWLALALVLAGTALRRRR